MYFHFAYALSFIPKYIYTSCFSMFLFRVLIFLPVHLSVLRSSYNKYNFSQIAFGVRIWDFLRPKMIIINGIYGFRCLGHVWLMIDDAVPKFLFNATLIGKGNIERPRAIRNDYLKKWGYDYGTTPVPWSRGLKHTAFNLYYGMQRWCGGIFDQCKGSVPT